MIYDVYAEHEDSQSVLLCDGLWVVNGAWQIEKRGKKYYVKQYGTELDIKKIGTVDSKGDYNEAIDKFHREQKKRKRDRKTLG